VHIFKLYGGWVAWVASEAELRQVVADVNRRGMAIAFEAGPLTPTEECTGEIEGFAGPDEGIRIVQRIKAAGGTITYVDLEHPYDAATFTDAPDSCHMTPEDIAWNVSRFIETVRSVFPDAIFGAVETAQHDVQEIARWVEAYRAVMGEDLGYFHLDVDFGRPDWAQRDTEIEEYLRSRGIEFGLFYLGDWEAASDAEWLARAEQRFVQYEVESGGRPDHVIFQSWHPHPEQLLPDTDPSAFTYLINRYFRTRTELTLVQEQSPDGALTISGNLTDADGNPLSEMPIELRMRPAEGPGLIFEYTFTGVVPDFAVQADLGYRINIECECSGPAVFTLYEVRYVEEDEEVNLVPNPVFAQGLEGWSAWGEARWRLEPSDRGSGRALHITAQPDEGAAINSSMFPTTAGASFTVTFVARVSPESAESGYFNLIFNDGGSIGRRLRFPLEAANILLGEAISDENGAYQVLLDEVPAATSKLQAWYVGDDEYWPAFVSSIFSSE
jgi:hypothetical protein